MLNFLCGLGKRGALHRSPAIPLNTTTLGGQVVHTCHCHAAAEFVTSQQTASSALRLYVWSYITNLVVYPHMGSAALARDTSTPHYTTHLQTVNSPDNDADNSLQHRQLHINCNSRQHHGTTQKAKHSSLQKDLISKIHNQKTRTD